MKLADTVRATLSALALAGLLAGQATAQQQQPGEKFAFDDARSLDIVDSNVTPAQFAAGGLGVGGGYGGGLGMDFFDHGCSGQFYAGGEYLYVRANYSQAISYVTANLPAGGPTSVTFNQFDFDYGDSFRFYGGYRLCECGGDLRFTYTQLNSDSAFQSPLVPGDTSQQFFAPLEVVADTPGTSLNGRAEVELNIYDIEFGKTIPLGCPMGCCGGAGGCDSCCDAGCTGDACGGGCGSGCGACCCCPAWDISWRGGVRIADLDSEFIYDNTIPANPALEQTSRARQTFEGAGLRWGMTGRRYLGRQGLGSLYIKGDLSVLLGDHTIVADSVVGTGFSRHEISCTHIIPVTEIEAGGTICLTDNITVSGGYLFSAWHDLGYRIEQPFSTAGTGVQLEGFDDANILGFDGFFVRGEVAF